MKKSSVCIWLAFVVIALFALFPPWVDNYGGTHHKLWHVPINRPPEDAAVPAVDYPRMFTEIAVGECFVLALYLDIGQKGATAILTVGLVVAIPKSVKLCEIGETPDSSRSIPYAQVLHRTHFMPFRASAELVQSLRVILETIDEVFPSQGDEPFVAELKRVVLLRIAEVESPVTDKLNSTDEPTEGVESGSVVWLRLHSE